MRLEPEWIVRAIRSAPRVNAVPFHLLSLQRVFPDDVYRELRSHLPASDLYDELRHKDAKLPDGRYARLAFPLTKENLSRVDDAPRRVLGACALALHHPDVRSALVARFAAALARRRVPQNVTTTLRISLLRDLPGYTISPHQDVPRKLVTAQVYLPSDDSARHLGTSFHRRAGNRLETVATLPYKPNSGYAFPVTADSWHGVDRIPSGEPPRDSLMLIWYLDAPLWRLRTSIQQAARSVRSTWRRRPRGSLGAGRPRR